MKIQEIYELDVQMGIKADFRGEEGVKEDLKERKERYDKLSKEKKESFDMNKLENPYPDSRILNISEDKEIKKVLVGIDIEPAEILIAKELGDVDLIIGHHPLGKGLAELDGAMALQVDVLAHYGVPVNISESLVGERISEVARGLNGVNHQRTVDAAKIMNTNLMCQHTTADNLAADFLRKKIEKKSPKRLGDIIDILREIPEYKAAEKEAAGPMIFVGSKESRCGKIALTEITGGTSGSPKIYEKMAQSGIGTIVGMHMGKEHYNEAKQALINVVIAGHMSSDSLGMNIFLDELEKKGVEIVPCSGFLRVSRA